MILPVLVASLTALAPILRGSWDLWAQSLLHLATIIGFSAWLVIRILTGYLPVPSSKTSAWIALLLPLSALSAYLSPVYGLSRPEWWNFLNALWIFPAMAALSKDQRSWIDESIRAASWILMLLAFHQHISLGQQRPASALVNQNVYAGAILMFLPLAVEKEDYLLALGLLLNLLWCRSVGAWMGLSAALALTQRRFSPARFWSGATGCLVCAIILYAKLGSPDALHRWEWWKSAAGMWRDRPILGYGPGAFAFVLPAYQSTYPGGLFSAYAHNYPLQTAAEMGLPCCLVWFAGLWHCIERTRSLKRFGIIAVLIHSLWDYTLSMPSNLWLFCYFAASSVPDNPEGVNIPARYKLPLACFVMGLGAALASGVQRQWDGHRDLARAEAALTADRIENAQQALIQAHRKIPSDPEVPLAQAALHLRAESWLDAAAALEEAVHLNAYRASAWAELAYAYRKMNRPDLAEQSILRSQAFLARPGTKP